ncbi:S-layer protein, putative [Babesia caballi]|uniref:S-layer protein, putative n=1 Tax=Babesia caballi TaxID=5871 RepID=A0AAV4LPS5_BABCB|nr:S-layer protein, putative [Babesia caballi]
MRALQHLSLVCYVASPPGASVDRAEGSSYVVSCFGDLGLPPKPYGLGRPKRTHLRNNGMLDGPYYHQNYEEKQYDAAFNSDDDDDEEDEMDDIERQLLEAQREKQLSDRLERLVRRSAALEVPKTYVETQAMFPPGNPNDDAANREEENIQLGEFMKQQGAGTGRAGSGADPLDGEATMVTAHGRRDEPLEKRLERQAKSAPKYTDEELERMRAEVPPLKPQFDDYAPVRLPCNANSTSELITGIIQLPDIKDKKALQESIKIKDYTEMDDEPIEEDDIWLRGINEERAKRGEPELQIAEGQKPSDNPEFVKEMRALRLRETQDLRRVAHEARERREEMKHTFYRKLPRNERGYAKLSAADIKQLHFEEVKEELRARGHRTSGGEKVARRRLEWALEETDDWRYRNIVAQRLDESNENLPEHARERIVELKKKAKLIKESGWNSDMMTAIERLKAQQEIIRFRDDPVGYLDLDYDEASRGVSKEEAEEMLNAPVVHNTAFIEAMQNPINRLPDIIPRTFNLQPDIERPYPRYVAGHRTELEELKKEYLSFKGGIHEETLPEISHRYEVSLDFLGDACCRLGAIPPVPLDTPLRGIISYSAIWDLVEFLNIADTIEIEAFYSIMNIAEIAADMNKSVDEVVEACGRLRIKLPYGPATRLNLHCLSVLEKLLINPHLDLELLAHDPARRDPFRDDSDTRPNFPNSMQDDIHRAAVEQGAMFDQPEFHGDVGEQESSYQPATVTATHTKLLSITLDVTKPKAFDQLQTPRRLSLALEGLLVDRQLLADGLLLALADAGDNHVDAQQHASGLDGALEHLSLDGVGVQDLPLHGVADLASLAVEARVDLAGHVQRRQLRDDAHGVGAAVLRQRLGNHLERLRRSAIGPALEPGLAVELGRQPAGDLDLRGAPAGQQLALEHDVAAHVDGVLQVALDLVEHVLGRPAKHDGAGLGVRAVDEVRVVLVADFPDLEEAALGADVARQQLFGAVYDCGARHAGQPVGVRLADAPDAADAGLGQEVLRQVRDALLGDDDVAARLDDVLAHVVDLRLLLLQQLGPPRLVGDVDDGLRLALFVLQRAVQNQHARVHDAARHVGVRHVLVDQDAVQHDRVLGHAAGDLLDLGVALHVDDVAPVGPRDLDPFHCIERQRSDEVPPLVRELCLQTRPDDALHGLVVVQVDTRGNRVHDLECVLERLHVALDNLARVHFTLQERLRVGEHLSAQDDAAGRAVADFLVLRPTQLDEALRRGV